MDYDLSRTPYLLYLPEAFVLYVNPVTQPLHFETYPIDWPDIGTKALIFWGNYPGLSGQFLFNFKLDSILLFTMGLPAEIVLSEEEPGPGFFQATIHEGFYYYQSQHFGEIP